MIDEQLPPRCRGLLRMWRVLVLLRCRPHTLQELADKLGVCTRTVRRDLKALQAVPLPVDSRFAAPSRAGIRGADPNEWFVGEMPGWPRREVVPTGEAVALPPFPKGPLLPPGARL